MKRTLSGMIPLEGRESSSVCLSRSDADVFITICPCPIALVSIVADVELVKSSLSPSLVVRVPGLAGPCGVDGRHLP